MHIDFRDMVYMTYLKSIMFSRNFLPSEKQEVAFANISDGGIFTVIRFTYHTNSQMFSILKKTALKCSHISQTYRIGRSVEGKDLLAIEFSNNPGQHEICEYGGTLLSEKFGVRKIFYVTKLILLFSKDVLN